MGTIKSGLQRLISEKVHFEGLQKQKNAIRQAKLKRFLDAYHHANQWEVCLAALYDAYAHGVPPTDSMIEDVIQRCGAKGKINEAKKLYTSFYQSLSRPRPMSVHVTFMSACAACGAVEEAKTQLDNLVEYDVRRFEKNPAHLSVVTDELMTAYLKAALAAHVKGQRTVAIPSVASSSTRSSLFLFPSGTKGEPKGESSSSSSFSSFTSSSTEKDGASGKSSASSSSTAVWEMALTDLVRLRQQYHPRLFRSRIELTPLLLECAAQLADVGNQWTFSLRLLRSAAQAQALIPPEAYDAVIRVCYRNHRHTEVVQLLETMIATKSAPDERSVRLGLVSAEEVEASKAQKRLLLAPQDFPLPSQDQSTGGASITSAVTPPLGVTPPLDSPLNNGDLFFTASSIDSSGIVPEVPTAGGSVSSPSSSDTISDSCAWSVSLSLFQSMRQNGVLLYQQSYEAPLRACALAGKWEEAMQMLYHMRRDGRPVSTALFRVVIASQIEYQCKSFKVVRHLLALPSVQGDHGIAVLFLAAMRWCVKRKDWKNMESLHKEMLNRDIPESYDKMRLLIEAAYHQRRYHAVLARFARFYNITTYERTRVEKDKSARLYEDDFYISAPLLKMVLEAHAYLWKEEKMKDKLFQEKNSDKKRTDTMSDGFLEKKEGVGKKKDQEEETDQFSEDNVGSEGRKPTLEKDENIEFTRKQRKKDPLLLVAYQAAKDIQRRLYSRDNL